MSLQEFPRFVRCTWQNVYHCHFIVNTIVFDTNNPPHVQNTKLLVITTRNWIAKLILLCGRYYMYYGPDLTHQSSLQCVINADADESKPLYNEWFC